MGAGSRPPSGARIIHHGQDKLLIQQDSVPDGEIALPIQEGTHHTHSLRSPLPQLLYVRRQGKSCISGYPQISSSVDPFDWFPEVLLVGVE